MGRGELRSISWDRTGGNVTVAQAYASDISTPEQRTRALGLIGGAFGLGFILGPALVGLLALLAPTLLVAPLLGAALAGAYGEAKCQMPGILPLHIGASAPAIFKVMGGAIPTPHAPTD